MAELVTVTAVQPFPYRGRTIKVGETLSVSPVEALALTYQKKAKFAQPMTRYRTAAVTPETVEAPKTKRQYRRRDLQAEE